MYLVHTWYSSYHIGTTVFPLLHLRNRRDFKATTSRRGTLYINATICISRVAARTSPCRLAFSARSWRQATKKRTSSPQQAGFLRQPLRCRTHAPAVAITLSAVTANVRMPSSRARHWRHIVPSRGSEPPTALHLHSSTQQEPESSIAVTTSSVGGPTLCHRQKSRENKGNCACIVGAAPKRWLHVTV